MSQGLILRVVRGVRGASRLAVSDPRALLFTLRLAVWVLLISIVARFVSLPAMLRFAESKRRLPERSRRSPEELARHIDRIFWGGVITDGSCWKRSAVLRRYLMMSSIETEVVFGVRKESGGELAGHAWLERNGQPFLEREPPNYTVTFRYPSS